ncbi:MAG TPA: Pr6Pr family membrane protein [Candidatus Dormibacteraeota bacterium]
MAVSATGPNGPGAPSDTAILRGLNVFAFFTVWSNVLVGVTTLLLALDLERPSTVFCTLRLIGVAAITVTFLVYHVALAHLLDLDSWALVAETILHTGVPILTIAGWLMFGPRGMTSTRVVQLTALFPATYMVFAVFRGAITGFYPYPFADVGALGYPRVIVNGVWITALFMGIAAGLDVFDRWLVRRERPA